MTEQTRPDSPGLWTRDGKFYRVWRSVTTGKLSTAGEICLVSGVEQDRSPVSDLPTGNWRKLPAEPATGEGQTAANRINTLLVPPPDIEAAGARLKKLRLGEAKKGLREFAESINVLPSRYCEFENGRGELNVAEVLNVLDALQPPEHANLRQVVEQQRVEIEGLKRDLPKVVIEFPDDSPVKFADIWFTEWRGDELHVCASIAPRPEVIEGHGQVVKDDDLVLSSTEWKSCRHMIGLIEAYADENNNKVPRRERDAIQVLKNLLGDPPRHAFNPPPKVLVRHKVSGNTEWVCPNTLEVYGDVLERLDDAGNVIEE